MTGVLSTLTHYTENWFVLVYVVVDIIAWRSMTFADSDDNSSYFQADMP